LKSEREIFMNDKLNKKKVQSKPNQQDEKDIQSYWTKEQQEKAIPLPIPSISPPKKENDLPKERLVKNNEVISEPVKPDRQKQ
jgi:hypothetical protein